MQTRRFGRTGHMSTVTIFGAASLGKVTQAEADTTVEKVIAADVNHLAVHGGAPTITCGPWGGNICEANEWVDLESLAPIARVHVSTVMAMLGAE